MSERPSLVEVKKLRYIPFKTIREEWARFELQDGTILKVKHVLINVRASTDLVEEIMKSGRESKERPLALDIQMHNVIGVEVKPDQRGPPDEKPLPVDQLREFVVQEDLEFKRLDQTTWVSRYELEGKFQLKVQCAVTNVDKTSKYDRSGDPIYVVDTSGGIKIVPPRKLRRGRVIKPRVVDSSIDRSK